MASITESEGQVVCDRRSGTFYYINSYDNGVLFTEDITKAKIFPVGSSVAKETAETLGKRFNRDFELVYVSREFVYSD